MPMSLDTMLWITGIPFGFACMGQLFRSTKASLSEFLLVWIGGTVLFLGFMWIRVGQSRPPEDEDIVPYEPTVYPSSISGKQRFL